MSGAASPGGKLLGILLGIYALGYLDRQIISLLVMPLRRDLGISDIEVSVLQGLGFVVSYTVCGLFMGYLVDRVSRRAIIATGLAIWSVCSALSALADSYTQLLIARVGVGAGEAALLPAAYSMISDAYPREKLSRAMAVFSLGAIVGGAIALGIGGMIAAFAGQAGTVILPVIGTVYPWQTVFLFIGALGIPALGAIVLLHEPERTANLESGGGSSADGHFVRHWRFYLCHIAGFSLLCTMSAAAVAWQPAFFQRAYGWEIERVGAVLGVIHLVAGVLGMLGGGWLADRLQQRGHTDGHMRIYTIAIPVLAVSAWLAFRPEILWLSIFGICVISVIAPFIAVAASALALGTPANRRGFASAVFLFIYNLLGFGLGPTAAAILIDAPAPLGGSLGAALASLFVLIAPFATLLFILGMAPMRRAVEATAAVTKGGANSPVP
ncbi:MAG: MFS transporter [Novosphingobium sp.]|nr:MFS transporter [Novosphingobium sp.]